MVVLHYIIYVLGILLGVQLIYYLKTLECAHKILDMWRLADIVVRAIDQTSAVNTPRKLKYELADQALRQLCRLNSIVLNEEQRKIIIEAAVNRLSTERMEMNANN